MIYAGASPGTQHRVSRGCPSVSVSFFRTIPRSFGLSCAVGKKAAGQKQYTALTCSAAASDTSSEQDANEVIIAEPMYEGEYCMPAEIDIDNTSNDRFTLVTVSVKDYPGLVRVVAWVLNGLELVVENAILTTVEDGIAQNTFWLTDRQGRKLKQKRAELMAERLGDYITYCTPDDKEIKATMWEQGPIRVDNDESEKHTVVTITMPKKKSTALLEIASTVTGVGFRIHEAIIQGCTSCGGPEIPLQDGLPLPDANRQLYKIWVTDSRCAKLDYGRAQSLLFTLGLVFGLKTWPLAPPGSQSLAGR